MAGLKTALEARLASGPSQRKGRWHYGRRVKSSGAPPTKHKRRTFWEYPEDRCAKHHAYRAGCGCGRT